MFKEEQKPNETARDYAFRILRENIVSLKLKPGAAVSEKELADELGISRTPVREALIELSKMRVVEIFPQKKSKIALIDLELVEEADNKGIDVSGVNIMIYGNENKAAPPWAANIDINQDYINPYWPAKLLIECGMASAIFRTSDIESDNRDAFPSGLVKFFNTNMNEKYTAGCISAWGFSVSRIIDYLVKCEEIDSRYISVTGHSRGGKTALWCAAMDERITCAFANNPGCGGASMGKLTKGEKIHQITEAFPHWFSDNYKKYSGQEETMDFDQHMLLGLVAPRLLYITSGSEDYWNDPDSEFAGCYYTNEIYNAYGLPGLVSDSNKRPEIRKPLHDGKIGYHIRAGGHDLSLFDWMLFLNFLKKHS